VLGKSVKEILPKVWTIPWSVVRDMKELGWIYGMLIEQLS
jgi:hypothetical protein